MSIHGWTPREFATASATAVLGPRLDSSMLQGGHRLRFGSGLLPFLHGGVVVVLIAHLERRPRSSSVLVDPLRRGFYTCPGAVATAATIGGVFGMRWLIRFGEGF